MPMKHLMQKVKKKVSVIQLYLTLQPHELSPPGSSVYGILQARIQEWVAIPFSRGSSWSRGLTQVSHIAGRFFTIWATREAQSISYNALKRRKMLICHPSSLIPHLSVDKLVTRMSSNNLHHICSSCQTCRGGLIFFLRDHLSGCVTSVSLPCNVTLAAEYGRHYQ